MAVSGIWDFTGASGWTGRTGGARAGIAIDINGWDTTGDILMGAGAGEGVSV
jgi:hypothetical protein